MKRRTVAVYFGDQCVRLEVQLGDLASGAHFIETARAAVRERHPDAPRFRCGEIIDSTDGSFPDAEGVVVRPVEPVTPTVDDAAPAQRALADGGEPQDGDAP